MNVPKTSLAFKICSKMNLLLFLTHIINVILMTLNVPVWTFSGAACMFCFFFCMNIWHFGPLNKLPNWNHFFVYTMSFAGPSLCFLFDVTALNRKYAAIRTRLYRKCFRLKCRTSMSKKSRKEEKKHIRYSVSPYSLVEGRAVGMQLTLECNLQSGW